MTPERWKRIKEILDAALERDPDEREDLLQKACGRDAALRREVDSLIDSVPQGEALELPPLDVEDARRLFEEEPPNLLPSAREASPVGRLIGSYRIVKELGRGGMGAVYLAVRHDDEFRKRVAIKLLPAGMDSEEVLRRFRTERQILASIEHPNIARLLDGGSTEDGLPYIVMEFVDGTPIDAYCDSKRLTIEERLRLFQSVCAAVHFAHQNLVIHRDLKPANLLVTEEGVPKLLDFGIAKLLNPELGAGALEPTRTGRRLMTPEYASPEQMRGETVTTASDVYSLGVLLYELLTGHRPYRLTNRPFLEIERAVCEEEPAPPSAVVGLVEELPGPAGSARKLTPDGVSSSRGTTASKLRRRLAGDLDNICLLALRKEPQRRYASAEQLSEDLGRAVEGLPVKARKPTLAYRASKFVRRYRAAVAAALLLVLTLLVFSGLVLQERNRARREADRAAAVVRFLQETMRAADPVDGIEQNTTLVDALDEAVSRMESFSGEPEIQADLQFTIGLTYYRLGRLDEALPLLRASLQTLETREGTDPAHLAEVLEALGLVQSARGEAEEAVSLLERVLAIREKTSDPLDPTIAEALVQLGSAYRDRGAYDRAEKALERALEIEEATTSPAEIQHPLDVLHHVRILRTSVSLGVVYAYQGRYSEAEPLLRRSVQIAERVTGPESGLTGEMLTSLGVVLLGERDYEPAEEILLRASSVSEKARGPEHPSVARAKGSLGALYVATGRSEEAEPLLQRSVAVAEEEEGRDALPVGVALSCLAAARMEQGRDHEAEPLLRRALWIVEGKLGRRHLFTGRVLERLGELRARRGDLEEGESLARRAVAIYRETLPEDHVDLADGLSTLARVLARKGSHEEARTLYRQALEMDERLLGPDHPASREIRDELAALRAR